MAKVNDLLAQRLKKNEQQSSKMAEMAKQSANGNLTSFSGMFAISELSEREKALLEGLLEEYSAGAGDAGQDLHALMAITSEVKAISNQAAILHGERIKKAHAILTKYKEGAFTAWLVATYGNRQTPYNFWQYYQFYESVPKNLRPQLEMMPRQAVYTLASREGPLEKKTMIVESYNGETKNEIMNKIRLEFPLPDTDKRTTDFTGTLLASLEKLAASLRTRENKMGDERKAEILASLSFIQSWVEG